MAGDSGISGGGTEEPIEGPFDPLGALRVLVAHGVAFIVIGGYGASIRGSPLITGDLDICYSRDLPNLRRLAEALRELGARLRGAPTDILFHLNAEALRAGDHFTFITDAGWLDCLGTPVGTGGFPDLNAATTEEDLEGLLVRVASLEDLMRMKLAAGRSKDLVGLEWLGAVRDELGDD